MTRAQIRNSINRVTLALACSLTVACATDATRQAGDKRETAGAAVAAENTANVNRDKAIVAYRDYLENYPESSDFDAISRRLADLLMQQAAELKYAGDGRPASQRAQDSYTEAIEQYVYLLNRPGMQSEEVEILYQLSLAYQETGRQEQALASIDRLLQIQDSGSEFQLDTLFRKAEMSFDQRDYRLAAESYQSVVDHGAAGPAYEQALYKLAWSLLNTEQYPEALATSFSLLELKLPPTETFESQLAQLSEPDQAQVSDILRLIGTAMVEYGGVPAIERNLESTLARPYAHQSLLAMADRYVRQEQPLQAAETLLILSRRNPLKDDAPGNMARAVSLFEASGASELAMTARAEYAELFAAESGFWSTHDPDDYPEDLDFLRQSLRLLARAARDRALQTKDPQDVASAEQWYQSYLTTFAGESGTDKVYLERADLLYQTGLYRRAQAAYDETARHSHDASLRAQAALGAIYAGERLTESAASAPAGPTADGTLARDLEFIENHPSHPLTPTILVRAGTTLLERQRYEEALELGARQLDQASDAPAQASQTAWSLQAQALYAMQDYPGAERCYESALRYVEAGDNRKTALEEGLAMAVYQQALQAESNADYQAAQALYQRVGEIAPGATLRGTAALGTAEALLQQAQWGEAIDVLERYRLDHPGHPNDAEVSAKLANAYEELGDIPSAVVEYEQIARNRDLPESVRGDAMLYAADLAERSGNLAGSIALRELFVTDYAPARDIAILQMQHIADLEEELGDTGRRRYWLEQLIERQRGSESAQSVQIASRAALELADYNMHIFREITLQNPLQASLAKKTGAMHQAIDWYETAASYQNAPVTNAATHQIASLYFDMFMALLESERPADLTTQERAEYDQLLAEQALPFEQRAIDFYTLNTARRDAHRDDPWIEKSSLRLRELQQESR